jgi:hypothetical protein
MTSWPVIPSATDPRATKRGISDAGRNTLFVSSASSPASQRRTGLMGGSEPKRRPDGGHGCI